MVLRLALTLFALTSDLLHAASLPEHAAVVYPQLFDVRDDLGTRVLKVSDKITLNLKKSSVLHDDFVLIEERQGAPQHTYFDVEALEEDLYHDEKYFASVMVTEEDGGLKVEGVVGPNLKIRPLEEMGRSAEGHNAHLLEPIEKDSSDAPTVYGEPINEPKETPSERSGSIYDVQIVYPEIRIVVDSTFRAGFKSKRRMMNYLIIEFNTINLRYLTVSRPRVQLVFRSVEITKAGKETYFKRVHGNTIDGLKSLYALVEYVDQNKVKYSKYDIVFFVTGLDMAAVQGSTIEKTLQGYAFVGSVCTKTRVGLGEDSPYTYIGVRIMAHEIGHTLGCSHDGSAIDGHIKHYKADSTRCPWEHGYLMSYIEENSNSMKFSSCCDYSISLVAWSREITCLHHMNSTRHIKRKYNTTKIPGDILSWNKQCRMTYPTLKKTYFMKEYGIKNCKAECFVPGEQFQAADHHWPMLLIDGTACDKSTGRVCINGDCVLKKRRYMANIVGK
uniref:Putative tick metalloprotease 1 n=1 Tax=Amblyomma triste TaxID=251400 RepID=A0A023GET3_AMBTT